MLKRPRALTNKAKSIRVHSNLEVYIDKCNDR